MDFKSRKKTDGKPPSPIPGQNSQVALTNSNALGGGGGGGGASGGRGTAAEVVAGLRPSRPGAEPARPAGWGQGIEVTSCGHSM